MPIAIIVHGGAGTFAAERHELATAGCRKAALVGWRVLQAGGSALDAVEAAVRALEDNSTFNAGTGSTLTAEGKIEMDAGMMEGHTLNVGAVAGVEYIKNPISLARKVLESQHVLLIGRGAGDFAAESGLPLCTLDDLMTERQYQNWQAVQQKQAEQQEQRAREAREASETSENAEGREEPRYLRREVWSLPGNDRGTQVSARPSAASGKPEAKEDEQKHGTVGAAALDMSGNLAAATSTGGIFNKYPGRVGDSPLVGCGFYADEYAAVSCTGQGEDFMRLLVAKRAADFVARGDNASTAAEAAIGVLGAKADGRGGLILVDRLGNVGFAWNTENLARAYMAGEMDEPVAGV